VPQPGSVEDDATLADAFRNHVKGGEWLVWGMRIPNLRWHEKIWRWQLEHTPTLERRWPWTMLGRQQAAEDAEKVFIDYGGINGSDGRVFWRYLQVRHVFEGLPPLPDELTRPPDYFAPSHRAGRC